MARKRQEHEEDRCIQIWHADGVEIIPVGGVYACDFCNEEMDGIDEDKRIGSHALCDPCWDRYKDELTCERCERPAPLKKGYHHKGTHLCEGCARRKGLL